MRVFSRDSQTLYINSFFALKDNIQYSPHSPHLPQYICFSLLIHFCQGIKLILENITVQVEIMLFGRQFNGFIDLNQGIL